MHTLFLIKTWESIVPSLSNMDVLSWITWVNKSWNTGNTTQRNREHVCLQCVCHVPTESERVRAREIRRQTEKHRMVTQVVVLPNEELRRKAGHREDVAVPLCGLLTLSWPHFVHCVLCAASFVGIEAVSLHLCLCYPSWMLWQLPVGQIISSGPFPFES